MYHDDISIYNLSGSVLNDNVITNNTHLNTRKSSSLPYCVGFRQTPNPGISIFNNSWSGPGYSSNFINISDDGIGIVDVKGNRYGERTNFRRGVFTIPSGQISASTGFQDLNGSAIPENFTISVAGSGKIPAHHLFSVSTNSITVELASPAPSDVTVYYRYDA
ncbi:hypothetical protein [Photorhabdus akhurstii]|uniref:hypothetical protein n=1 Tax=Photorhabdus akhurstii TaxID=171438 RepID=UPI003703B7E6